MADKNTAKTPEVAQEIKTDEMHLDDFLNSIEQAGSRELAAAFGFFARAKNWVKKEIKDWQTEFEKFLKSPPEVSVK